MLINILGNAIKFTDQGSIDFMVELVQDRPDHQRVRITVADTGIGMSADFQKKLFNKFAQERISVNRKYEGTGLGMAIVRELILLMQGDIRIDSTLGRGTTITIDLKLPKGDETKLRQSAASLEKNTFAGNHILIVEDNDMNRFIALQTLHFLGLKVDEAVNGLEAIKMAGDKDYDLILMDIQMPEMDGLEATLQIRNTLKQDVPIIALTANAFRHDIDRYLSAGIDTYIIKPYSEEELFNKLRHYLTPSEMYPEPEIHNDPDGTSAGKNIHRPAIETASGIHAVAPDQTSLPLYDIKGLSDISYGDDAFLDKMLNIFVSQAEKSMEEFHAALENRDIITINQTAHRIKPSIDKLGIHSIRHEIRELEAWPADGDPRQLNERIKKVSDTLAEVSARIRNR